MTYGRTIQVIEEPDVRQSLVLDMNGEFFQLERKRHPFGYIDFEAIKKRAEQINAPTL